MAIDWLQEWFATQCNGDWAHRFGISIGTLDNPGWELRIDLAETPLMDAEFEPVKVERNEDDWLHCQREGKQWIGRGGPGNLVELIETFARWSRVP